MVGFNLGGWSSRLASRVQEELALERRALAAARAEVETERERGDDLAAIAEDCRAQLRENQTYVDTLLQDAELQRQHLNNTVSKHEAEVRVVVWLLVWLFLIFILSF